VRVFFLGMTRATRDGGACCTPLVGLCLFTGVTQTRGPASLFCTVFVAPCVAYSLVDHRLVSCASAEAMALPLSGAAVIWYVILQPFSQKIPHSNCPKEFQIGLHDPAESIRPIVPSAPYRPHQRQVDNHAEVVRLADR